MRRGIYIFFFFFFSSQSLPGLKSSTDPQRTCKSSSEQIWSPFFFLFYKLEMILLSAASPSCRSVIAQTQTAAHHGTPQNPHPPLPPRASLSASRMWESSLTENSAPSLAKFTLPSSGYPGWLIRDKRLTRFWISLCDCESNLTQFKCCASPRYRKRKKKQTKKKLPYVYQGTLCFER